MFKIVLIFLTIILCKIVANTFNCSIEEIVIQGKSNFVIMTYNIIYYYSMCQIKCNQIYNNIIPYLDIFKNKTENVLMGNIELFDLSTNKNKIFTEIEQEVFNQIILSIQSPNNLLIISKLSQQMISNKKIINKKIDADICNNILDFDISKVTFIALYLNYNDVRYNINLKTETFNYYLVGNIIDKQFVQYYINNILKLNFCYKEEDLLSYQLELMDREVNMVILNPCQYILIEKDSYQILHDKDDLPLVLEKEKEKEKEKES